MGEDVWPTKMSDFTDDMTMADSSDWYITCKFCGEEMNLINGFAFLILALIFKYWIEEQFFWYCLIIANVYFASVGNK